jgi:hypothetical protein
MSKFTKIAQKLIQAAEQLELHDQKTERLSPEAKALFDEIHGIAVSRKDYEENNSDAMDGYEDGMRREFTKALMGGQGYRAGPYGHGEVQLPQTPATKAFEELLAATPQDIMQDKVSDAVRYNTDIKKTREVDQENDLVVFRYETEDMVEDQLDDDMMGRLGALNEDDFSELVEALRMSEPEVRLEQGENLIHIGDVNADWSLCIKVDDLIQEVQDELGQQADG